MFSLKRIYFIILFVLIFSGCTLINTNKVIERTESTIQKPIKIKEQKVNIKKPEVKKTRVKKTRVKKKVFTYKYCDKHIKIMNHASKYIQEEFKKGYFIKKDIVGAKAQLFLIESNSKSIFAKNINNALKSYKNEYKEAKKNKCDLHKFVMSPLEKIKLEIKELEKDMLKKEDKK